MIFCFGSIILACMTHVRNLVVLKAKYTLHMWFGGAVEERIGRCGRISLLHTGYADILFSSDYEVVSMKGQHEPYVCIRSFQMKFGHS